MCLTVAHTNRNLNDIIGSPEVSSYCHFSEARAQQHLCGCRGLPSWSQGAAASCSSILEEKEEASGLMALADVCSQLIGQNYVMWPILTPREQGGAWNSAEVGKRLTSRSKSGLDVGKPPPILYCQCTYLFKHVVLCSLGKPSIFPYLFSIFS